MSASDKPRFLIVNQYHFTRFTGGAEMQTWILSKELVKRGWEVHYASEMNSPPPSPMDGIALHGLPENPSVWLCNRSPLRKLMESIEPDVVLTKHFSPYLRHIVRDAPRNAFRIWWVSSRYGTANWPYIQLGWKNQPGFAFIRRAPANLYSDYVARQGRRNVQLILAQHRDQQSELKALGIQSEVFHNAHPVPPESDVQKHEGRPLVLWADSIKLIKRPEVFIELARRCRDVDAEFLVIGRPYDDDYKRMIDEAIRDCPNLTYGGFIPVSEVNQYFRRAHLHVKTSLPIEGFPNTFVQSWMHGVPVIAYGNDPGGFLREQHLGFCGASVDELEHALRSLLTNAEMRREIGNRARATAMQEFNLERNADKLERLLRERGARMPMR